MTMLSNFSPVPAQRASATRAAAAPAEHLYGRAFAVEPCGRFGIVRVGVDLDVSSVKYLDRAIVRAAAECDGVVLDLRDCRACDSASLAMLAKHKYVRKERLAFVVAANGSVRRIFEITGLSRSIALHGAPEAALAELRAGAQA